MTSSHPLVGRRVVVVDDDPGQASVLATLLRLEGIVATHEDVATSALARLLLDPPDVLVIDVKMPGLSGTELFAQVRAKHPNIPVVFVTGYELHDPPLGNVMQSGRVAYVAKPLEMQSLLNALADLLSANATPSPTGGPAAWSH